MKKLQDMQEERWQFSSLALMDGVIRRVEAPKEVILLLHGYNERGRRLYRKLLPWLPQDALIISPNGPFPIPRPKEQRLDFGFAWYFYDRFKQQYFINQDLPKAWLQELLKKENPKDLPLTIIGFSQGGYLAPLLGLTLPMTKLVIGIGCEFRSQLLQEECRFPLEAIHGKQDEIITFDSALAEVNKLRQRGMTCGWHLLDDVGHEITSAVGERIKVILEQHGN